MTARRRSKIHTKVNFPLKKFDLGPYLSENLLRTEFTDSIRPTAQSHDEDSITDDFSDGSNSDYDLYGVINHIGEVNIA